MLSTSDIQLLQKPFTLDEHGFRDGNTPDDGKPYIHRQALINRLNEVDRGWKMHVNLKDLTIVGDVVALTGTLSIKGIEHTNVSTAIIQRLTKEGVEVKPFILAQNTERAIKSAGSSSLQRCLQFAGCGTYLKSQAFKGINNRQQLKVALDKFNTPPPPKVEDIPVQQIRGSDLQVDDMVSNPYGNKRIMHICGDTEDGVLVEIITWQKTQYTNVKRESFGKDDLYSVKRGLPLLAPPPDIAKLIEDCKKTYEGLKRANIPTA